MIMDFREYIQTRIRAVSIQYNKTFTIFDFRLKNFKHASNVSPRNALNTKNGKALTT